jgi:hypothetical protein
MKECFENLHSSKLENLDEMENSSMHITKQNWTKKLLHLNSSTASNEIEAVLVWSSNIVSLQRRAQDLIDSQLNFNNPLKN